jgi:hypothetical protein
MDVHEHETISGMISRRKPKYPQYYYVHHESDIAYNSLLPLSLGCMSVSVTVVPSLCLCYICFHACKGIHFHVDQFSSSHAS